jgi:hypothetical protein
VRHIKRNTHKFSFPTTDLRTLFTLPCLVRHFLEYITHLTAMLVFVLIFLISQSVKSAEVSPESNITESLATLSEKSSEKCMKEVGEITFN